MAFCSRIICKQIIKSFNLNDGAILGIRMSISCRHSLPNVSPSVWSSTTWNQEFYDHHTEKVDEAKPKTKFIVSKEDFKFVERLIPSLEVPEPPQHESYPTPSGWSPPKGPKEGSPYFIRRSRYHNLRVYIKQKHGGTQIWTVVQNVEGDIWTFGEKLLKHLEEHEGKEIGMSINEYARTVVYKGVLKDETVKWLENEGF